jgi:hypothetical protein
MPLDIAAIEASLRAEAMVKWAQTEVAVENFKEKAKEGMKAESPVDTANLQNEIDAKMVSTGSILTSSTIIVTTQIGDGLNPLNNIPASKYGYYQNYGFINARTKTFVAGKYFMEESERAFSELIPVLQAIW